MTMNLRSLSLKLSLALLVFVVFCGSGNAQLSTAAMFGTVTDPAGAAVLCVRQLGVRVQVAAEFDQLGFVLREEHVQIREQIIAFHAHHPPARRTCPRRTR